MSTRSSTGPGTDPVVALLLEGRAQTSPETQELYWNAHLAEVVERVRSPLAEEAFRRHPLISLLLACGSRGWEDSLTRCD